MDDTDHIRFWTGLLRRSTNAGVVTHAKCSPSNKSWIPAGTGKRGVKYVHTISSEESWIKAEILIEDPRGEKAYDKKAYDFLHARKEEIEASFGTQLEWHRSDTNQRSRICYTVPVVHLQDEATWDEAQNTMVHMMERLWIATSRFINEIPS